MVPKRLAVVASHPVQYQAPLFRALASRFDLTVFFAHRATPADQAKAGFGVGFDWDVDLLSGYENIFLRNAAKNPGLDWFGGCDTPEIGKRLAEGRFDAVLVHGWHLKAFLQATFTAKRLGLPLLARGDSHLETPRSPIKKAAKSIAYPAFLRLFNAALYVGQRSKAYWIHYGYPTERLFFSPHCVDTERFATCATTTAGSELRVRLGIASEASVVLFAGKLVPLKRPFDLIEAAKSMKARGRTVEILVAGAGPLEREMVSSANAAGVTVHVLGFCNQSEMPAVYSAADVLVLPSQHETWGLVANEAMACGRPVILADTVGAAPDLASDGTAGWIYPVGDIKGLADALISACAHPPTREAIVAKSAVYSPDAAADGICRAVRFVAMARDRFFA